MDPTVVAPTVVGSTVVRPTVPGLLALLIAFALEIAVGEPPDRFHPVAWFGALIAPIDREWTRPLVIGTLAAVGLPLGAAAVVGSVVVTGTWADPLVGTVLAGLAIFLTTSLRTLLSTARGVITATETDVATARNGLLALAGRDASDLSPGHLRSAAVESAAENLADGLVAPLGGFVLGGLLGAAVGLAPLAVAAALAVWVKAVNTMDSMLGYHAKRVGTPAARLDDAVMWLPARASALLLAVAFGAPRSLRRARDWLPDVPSPNSGWPMGATAAALDVRLEKPGVYVLNPEAALPSVQAAQKGVTRVGVAGILAYLLAVAGVMAWS